MAQPYFSIIISVYNRARLLERAIASCLAQSTTDFEIVIVDDASTDHLADVMQSYRQPFIRLIRHSSNQGAMASRATGAKHALGSWLIVLDSDDELVPDALTMVKTAIASIAPDVKGIRLQGQLDNGAISPAMPPPSGPLSFEAYLQWTEAAGRTSTDTLCCFCRDAIQTVSWLAGRQFETTFQLRFARQFRQQFFPHVALRIHSDAAARLTVPKVVTLERQAPQYAADYAECLAEFGEDLRRCVPRLYRDMLRGAATVNFIAGRRQEGLRYGWQSWRLDPLDVRPLVVMTLGLIHGRLVSTAKVGAMAVLKPSGV